MAAVRRYSAGHDRPVPALKQLTATSPGDLDCAVIAAAVDDQHLVRPRLPRSLDRVGDVRDSLITGMTMEICRGNLPSDEAVGVELWDAGCEQSPWGFRDYDR